MTVLKRGQIVSTVLTATCAKTYSRSQSGSYVPKGEIFSEVTFVSNSPIKVYGNSNFYRHVPEVYRIYRMNERWKRRDKKHRNAWYKKHMANNRKNLEVIIQAQRNRMEKESKDGEI